LEYVMNKMVKPLSAEEISALFETVRFPFLHYEQLSIAESNPLVPRYLLTEALLARLKKHEAPIDPNNNASNPDTNNSNNPSNDSKEEKKDGRERSSGSGGS